VQPAGFRCVRGLPPKPDTGHWARVIGDGQRALPARPPPAIDGAGADLPVAETASHVTAVQAPVTVVALIIHILYLQAGGGGVAGEFHGSGFIRVADRLVAEMTEQWLLGGTAQADGGGARTARCLLHVRTQPDCVWRRLAAITGGGQAVGHCRPI